MRRFLIFFSIIFLTTFANTFSTELYSWGFNGMGQLGDATGINRLTPQKVGGSKYWKSVSSHGWHAIGVRYDGTLWAWGANSFYQLGLNDTIRRLIPTRIGNDSNWVDVFANSTSSWAIKNDGTLWAWGDNDMGQLGFGDTLTRKVPAQVGNETDWLKISSKRWHTLGLKTDGKVYAWGNNAFGQIGNHDAGDTVFARFLVQDLVNKGSPVKDISAGFHHSIVLLQNGQIWGCGKNDKFELGKGDTNYYPIYARIDLTADFIAIGAGWHFCAALKNDGTVWTWGENVHGQIGDGTYNDAPYPKLVDSEVKYKQISAGQEYVLAITDNNEMVGWGNNTHGVIGDGSELNFILQPKMISTPKSPGTIVAGLASSYFLSPYPEVTIDISDISLTSAKFIGEVKNDAAYDVLEKGICWSSTNRYPTFSDTAIYFGSGLGSFSHLAQGLTPFKTYYVRAFARTQQGWSYSEVKSFAPTKFRVWAWGSKEFRQTGDSTTSGVFNTGPILVKGDVANVSKLFVGYSHNYMLKHNGEVVSWGNNTANAIGKCTAGHGIAAERHIQSKDFVDFALGWNHTLALKKDSTLWAWGANNNGQLGIGNFTNACEPVQIGNLKWKMIACGLTHSIGIRHDGALLTWGDGGSGKLGDTTNVTRNLPKQIGNDKWKYVAASWANSFAIKEDGTLWATGQNGYYQLGDSTTTPTSIFKQIGNDNNWVKVVCRENGQSVVATKSNGEMWGWGENGTWLGYLRLPDVVNFVLVPTKLDSLMQYESFDYGRDHVLALKSSGTAWAWGSNSWYQYGDSTNIGKPILNITRGKKWYSIQGGDAHTIALEIASVKPYVVLDSIYNIGALVAQADARVVDDGFGVVSERGICWSKNPEPTKNNDYISLGNGLGTYSGDLTDLSPGTTYYVRAYAQNGEGIAYSNEITFTTLNKFSQEIVLKQGWNLISTHIEPFNKSLDSIWNNIKGSVVIVKDNNGETYIPSFDINQIGDWKNSEGYQVYLTQDEVLSIEGNLIDPTQYPINMKQGWSIIPYLRTTPRNIENALSSIIQNDNLVIAKNNEGETYIPMFDINGIGNMLPGQGYQVYMSGAETLTYPANPVPGSVEIGNQIWMSKNLDVIYYRNGEPILFVDNPDMWDTLTVGAFCYINDDPATASTYGVLYNWYAVNDPRGLAPTGWKVPSDNDWKELEKFIGMSDSDLDQTGIRGITEGNKLKALGTTYWIPPNSGATNEFNFTAIAAGWRNGSGGGFDSFLRQAHWWTSSENLTDFAFSRSIWDMFGGINRSSNFKRNGYSVRLIRE